MFALSHSYFAHDLGWPLTITNHPNFYILRCLLHLGRPMPVDDSKSQPTDDKWSLKGTWSMVMATSLKISEKEGRIDHLQFNTYHTVQRLWKSVQRILRYFGSERTIAVRHKIGCHRNVPWGIGKTGLDQENSRKCLPFGEKLVKIGPVDTEIALLIVKKK